MANLVLFKVEKVEVLKAQDLGRGRMVTTLVIDGGDGRFEVSLHSDGPVEIKDSRAGCGHDIRVNDGLTSVCIFCGESKDA